MGFLDRFFGRRQDNHREPEERQEMQEPFMEHPTGQFESAVDAMADAIERLRALPEWNVPITFGAQGSAGDDRLRIASILVNRDSFQLNEPLDLKAVLSHAKVPDASLGTSGTNYSLGQASALESARILDAIFRVHFGIVPFPDEDDDYAVGAEW